MAEIIPAILTDDISDFRKKYAELFALSHHFTKLHIDFLDDEFIRNRTVMPVDLGFLKSSPLTLMAHFMTFRPEIYFEQAKEANFSWVIIHYESFTHENELTGALEYAKTLNLKTGLVLNPETPLFLAAKFISQVNMIQLMGIHPGFQGRKFMNTTYDKIKELRSLSPHAIIAVDGGVKVGIARECAKAGADYLVAGSAILRSEDEEAAIEALKADIEI